MVQSSVIINVKIVQFHQTTNIHTFNKLSFLITLFFYFLGTYFFSAVKNADHVEGVSLSGPIQNDWLQDEGLVK